MGSNQICIEKFSCKVTYSILPYILDSNVGVCTFYEHLVLSAFYSCCHIRAYTKFGINARKINGYFVLVFTCAVKLNGIGGSKH